MALTGEERPMAAPAEAAGGFDGYRFVHRALPELDFDAVSTQVVQFGRPLGAPIVLAGPPDAGLARAAGELSVPLMVEAAHLHRPDASLRASAGAAPLLLRLPAALLNRGLTSSGCRRLLEAWRADAVVLELTPLETAMASPSAARFASLESRIASLCAELSAPVLVSEPGHGLDPDVIAEVLSAGVAGLDVRGGEEVATAEAIRTAREVGPTALLIAGGGVRGGADVAKAAALGADLVVLDGAAGLERRLEELKLAMFGVGARHPAALRGTSRLTRVESPPGLASHVETLAYQTAGGPEFIDITDDVRAIVARSGVRQGMVHVFSHHTTAGVRVNENEPLLMRDFERLLDRLAPAGCYEHDDMSRRVGVPPDEPVNGHSHCRQLLLGGSETLPVLNGTLGLGTWQSVFLIELDGSRRRQVTVQVLGA